MKISFLFCINTIIGPSLCIWNNKTIFIAFWPKTWFGWLTITMLQCTNHALILSEITAYLEKVAVNLYFSRSFTAYFVYSINQIVGEPNHVFGQNAINMVLLFHMHNEGPITAFMQNRKDFFIYFWFNQNIFLFSALIPYLIGDLHF